MLVSISIRRVHWKPCLNPVTFCKPIFYRCLILWIKGSNEISLHNLVEYTRQSCICWRSRRYRSPLNFVQQNGTYSRIRVSTFFLLVPGFNRQSTNIAVKSFASQMTSGMLSIGHYFGWWLRTDTITKLNWWMSLRHRNLVRIKCSPWEEYFFTVNDSVLKAASKMKLVVMSLYLKLLRSWWHVNRPSGTLKLFWL